MSDRWTPGPWRAGGRGYIAAPDGRGEVIVCKVGAFTDREIAPFNRERWTADARLISAAPDMAEELSSTRSDIATLLQIIAGLPIALAASDAFAVAEINARNSAPSPALATARGQA